MIYTTGAEMNSNRVVKSSRRSAKRAADVEVTRVTMTQTTATLTPVTEVITSMPLDLSPCGQMPLDLSVTLGMLSTPTESGPIDVTRGMMIDASLAEAALTAVTTGSILPLVKEELKCTIQKKRLMEGKDELLVEYNERTLAAMNPEDELKRDRRRVRNKVAAQRCRSKRKTRADALELESTLLEDRNDELRDAVRALEDEKEKLRMLLTTHDACALTCCGCSVKLSLSSDTESAPDDVDVCDVTAAAEDDDDDDDDDDLLDGECMDFALEVEI